MAREKASKKVGGAEAKQTKGSQKPKGKNTARAVEQEISHAVNHWVRLEALTIFSERMASPNEISKELHVALGTASFHVNELLEAGRIEFVKMEPRRGAVEHFYRATTRPEITDEEWQRMPKSPKRRLASTLVSFVVSESLASLRKGKMDADDDLCITCIPARLRDEGRTKLRSIFAECQEQVEALKAEEEEGDNDAPVRFITMMHFERSRSGMPDGNAFGRARD